MIEFKNWYSERENKGWAIDQDIEVLEIRLSHMVEEKELLKKQMSELQEIHNEYRLKEYKHRKRMNRKIKKEKKQYENSSNR